MKSSVSGSSKGFSIRYNWIVLGAALCLGLGTGLSAEPDAGNAQFEVASVKQGADAGKIPWIDLQPGGLVVVHGTSLRELVARAYGVHHFQVLGGPSWCDRLGWDITARANTPKRITGKDLEPYLANLLATRYNLKVHRELREAPVYDLVVSKKGSKLKENTTVPAPNIGFGRGFLNGSGLPISTLTIVLSQMLDRVVEDKTGLTSKYDLYLEWTPEIGVGDSTFGAETDAYDGHTSKGNSLFSAIEEQLGLRLQPAKDKIETIVIDSADQASAN